MDEALLKAYRQARYRVHLPTGTETLTIDAASRPLARLLKCRNARGAAIITACNPASRLQTAAVNRAASARLDVRLAQAGHHRIPTTAVDPAGQWPDEPGVLVVGISRHVARAVAREFGQNALVWVDAGGVPCLETLTPASP